VVHRDTVYVFLFYLVEIFHECEYIIQVFFWTHLTVYVLAMSMYADGPINDDLPESRLPDTDMILFIHAGNQAWWSASWQPYLT
jgi:hypothetical protein